MADEASVSGAGCRVASLHDGWVPVSVDPDLPPRSCRSGDGLELEHGTRCVIMTREGEFLGTVTGFCAPIIREPGREADRIVRRATEDDEKRRRDLGHLEREIRDAVHHRAKELGLEMKPLKVHASLAGRTAIVYFSAEKRVDFRSLVRDLGRRYRRRIEMRPLGVRDAAKVVGGLGPCGRCLCCTTFMNRFHSVTVRMAKRQNLSLNPAKISGMCGRLMCCLSHEVEQYPSSRRTSTS